MSGYITLASRGKPCAKIASTMRRAGPLYLVPDHKHDNCMLCSIKFTVFKRRHHCRVRAHGVSVTRNADHYFCCHAGLSLGFLTILQFLVHPPALLFIYLAIPCCLLCIRLRSSPPYSDSAESVTARLTTLRCENPACKLAVARAQKLKFSHMYYLPFCRTAAS